MKKSSRFIFTRPVTLVGKIRNAVTPLHIDMVVHKVILFALVVFVLSSFVSI